MKTKNKEFNIHTKCHMKDCSVVTIKLNLTKKEKKTKNKININEKNLVYT